LLGLCSSSILKMIEPYCVKFRLSEGEPKTWIMRWWFRVNTKLECLGGQDRAPVDALGIYPGQRGERVILRLYIQFPNQPMQLGLLPHHSTTDWWIFLSLIILPPAQRPIFLETGSWKLTH
jgi:hypothetical protein